MRSVVGYLVIVLSLACNAWRVALWRMQGMRIGKAVKIGRGVRLAGPVAIGDGTTIDRDANISGKVCIGSKCQICVGAVIWGNIEIGEGSTIGNYTTLSTLADQGRLVIGNDVYINSFSVLSSSLSVVIKDHCIFAPFIQLGDATHGIDDPSELTKHSSFSKAPVVIEENVWLGSGVMVMMGVTIGESSVIGAKSLVNADIPPFSIAFGIPAKVTRTRIGAKSKN